VVRRAKARRAVTRLGVVRYGSVWQGMDFFKKRWFMTKKVVALKEKQVTNGASESIEYESPYSIQVEVCGSANLLFHRWNTESIAEKAAAAKGSKSKKTDNVESYVYRNDEGFLCIPTTYMTSAFAAAAKFKQDPRSPRKSAMDLCKAGIVPLSDLASLGTKDWDFLDQRRVTVQRAGITRTRPAMLKGWKAEFDFTIVLPEYLRPEFVHELFTMAGKLIGIGDFRPTHGRFQVTKFEILKD
jgi:hypothetical protein